MQVGAWIAHVLHVGGRVQPVQNIGQFLRVTWLNSALAPIVEEVFQAFVGKAGDHGRSVTDEVTTGKER